MRVAWTSRLTFVWVACNYLGAGLENMMECQQTLDLDPGRSISNGNVQIL